MNAVGIALNYMATSMEIEKACTLAAHHMDFDRFSNDGVLEPGMVVSVESYIGKAGAADGVKLEEKVLITDSRIAMISP